MLVLKCSTTKAKAVQRAVEILQSGGVIIYPTDTIYGIGCDMLNPQAIDRVYSIKKLHKRKPLSLICSNLNQIAEYAQLNNTAFNMMRRMLPGPYTFILQATRLVPRIMMTKQRTVGIRVPDNELLLNIITELGHPLVNTSATLENTDICDPDDIKNAFPLADLLLDAGICSPEPSTVIDISKTPATVLREGKGPIDGIIDLR